MAKMLDAFTIFLLHCLYCACGFIGDHARCQEMVHATSPFLCCRPETRKTEWGSLSGDGKIVTKSRVKPRASIRLYSNTFLVCFFVIFDRYGMKVDDCTT